MPELEPGPGVAGGRAMAAVTGEPLSPPHSPERRGNNNNSSVTNNNISDNNTDKPMDLSSGGGGLSLTQLFRNAELPLMGPDQAGLRRLADLVRAQHRQSEQRERETPEKWEPQPHTETETETVNTRRWPDRVSPGPAAGDPGSPAGSSSGSESGQSQSAGGREEKRRRLDMLLNKKFDKLASGPDNPIMMSTPPPSERETSPASDRRPSTESTGGQTAASALPLLAGDRKHRRKQSQPGSRPGTPPCISIRPHSDLFPPQPAATSTPRGHKEARDYSPARKMSRSQSPPPPQSKSPVATKLFNEEKENKDAFRNQLLQMQLASSLPGLSGSPSPEMLKALQYNPLLYYSYYAQMLTALQAQQKILDMNTGNPSSNNNNNSSANSIKDILSPVKLGKDSNQDSRSMLSAYFSPNSPASSLSPLSEEPRKRAPRALTGRYVRTGTAASPRVLQILRKKIEDRLKLKELLGENSHLYFGPVKQNAGSPYKSQIQQKHKKQKT